MTPKVSIIVPCYGVEQYLDECMDTLVNQTLREIEIILVDDVSPDRVPEMCDEWAKRDPRIKVIHKEKNGGLGYARNTGLDVATGEFVAFIDSDDYVDKEMFERLYTYANENRLDACYCDYINDTNGQLMPSREMKTSFIRENHDEVLDFLLDMIGPMPEYPTDVKHVISVWHAIYSNKIIQDNNIRFESERENASEDFTFNVDFLSKCERIGYIPFAGYYYRYNPISLSRGYNHKKFLCYKHLLTEIGERLEKICTRERYLLHYQRCLYYYFRTIIKYEAIKNIDGRKYSNICMRCKDELIQDVLKTYPYMRMPLKHKVFFFSMKYRIIPILYGLCVLENKIRKNI